MKIYAITAGISALTSSVAAAQAYGRFGAALDRLEVSSDVLPPKEDPWYTAPDGFETAAPGDVLRTRPAPGNLTSVIGNCSAGYNILYRTTDSRYQPTWAVTTLLIPDNAQYNPNDAFVSVQIPYDSADLNASPSYSLYDGSYSDALSTGLGAGFWLSVPDYEGPLASFTAGVMSGHATIDSVRAALAFGMNMTALNSEYVLANDTKYVMYGYSGGALASEWAAELQVQYAPELNFSGAAIGGLTPNISNVLLSVSGTLEAGLVAPGVVGLATQWPELMEFLQQNIYTDGPYNETAFFAVQNQTLIGSIQAFAGQDMSKYFKDGIGILRDPVPQKVIDTDGVMGYHGVPQMPLFVYKAIHDEVSPINDTDVLVARYCGVGATIKYDRNTIGSHSQEYVNGEGRVYEFLAEIFTGTYNATGCQIQNVTVGSAS